MSDQLAVRSGADHGMAVGLDHHIPARKRAVEGGEPSECILERSEFGGGRWTDCVRSDLLRGHEKVE